MWVGGRLQRLREGNLRLDFAVFCFEMSVSDGRTAVYRVGAFCVC